MIKTKPNDADPMLVALQALTVTISDENRAQSLLDLSGLSPDDLRARATQPQVLAAVMSFLEAHEPDLVSVANAIGRKPEELVAARSALEA